MIKSRSDCIIKLFIKERYTFIGDLKSIRGTADKEDSIMILATKINFINTTNYNQFVYLIQSDIEEPKMYDQAM